MQPNGLRPRLMPALSGQHTPAPRYVTRVGGGRMKHILAPRSTLVIVVLGRMATAVGSASAHVPGRCEVPASQRTAENGCYVSATVSLSDLPTDPLFRHLRTYPRPAARPRPLRGHGPLSSRRSERCGSTQSPRSSGGLRGGEHVITLGPLELRQGRRYT